MGWVVYLRGMEINLNVPDSVLIYVFTTAVEGGVNYWASAEDYSWSEDDVDANRVTLHVLDDEDEPAHVVTIETLRKGMVAMAADGRFGEIASILTEDYDSFDADVTVQYGIFGKVIFG